MNNTNNKENYKEKVEREIHAAFSGFEGKFTQLVKDLVVESFKNGVAAGKRGNYKQPKAEEAKGRNLEDEETS